MITEELVRKQLDTLHQEGSALAAALSKKEESEPFEVGYQRWYSRALMLMKQFAPDRLTEFQFYYSVDPKYSAFDGGRFVIQDYFRGRKSGDTGEETVRCFRSQLAILKSVNDRLSWMSLDTQDQAERSLQLELLETARSLISINERAAGALAGTVLETYLKKLAAKHQVKLRKQSPTVAELADALKAAKVLDIPAHSQLTWLAEIRSRSLKEGEAPTKLQIRDLADGTRWLITNGF